MTSRDWKTLNPEISPWLAETISSMGFSKMTPVQASVIPLFTGNKDVVVEAVTGSGKTLAFLVPIIERLSLTGVDGSEANDVRSSGQVGAVIVAPTRELAAQICDVLQGLLAFQPARISQEQNEIEEEMYQTVDSKINLKAQLVIGGNSTSLTVDFEKFKSLKPQILVGTPGRLYEFLRLPQVHCNSVQVLVLDEADRLLDLGFAKQVTSIVQMLPKQRRTGLFSATVTEAVGELVKAGLRNPVKIVVKVNNDQFQDRRVPTTLSISSVVLDPGQKIPALLYFLMHPDYKKAIVYFPTCASVVYLYGLICQIRSDFKIDPNLALFSLHGKLPQGPRTKTLANFVSSVSRHSVLFTTDVAARGLDIPEVDVVIQFDAPYDATMFLHRAGRAARAGRHGEGYIFLTTGREETYIDLLSVKKIAVSMLSRMTPGGLYSSLAGISATFYASIQNYNFDCREHYDQAIRAYVSYIRFYTNHTMTSIFRITEFDFVKYAKLFGLARLPRMPELRTVENLPAGGWLIDINDQSNSDGFDFDKLKYKDAKREAQRVSQLSVKSIIPTEAIKQKMTNPEKNNSAWSNKSRREELRNVRQEKKLKRKAATTTRDADSTSSGEDEQDWKELVTERKSKKPTMIFEL
ncbi:P-loop containing nucleoside triphosphate hydrolase protein [Lipomyces oligophaga]|uniref:P-loop containing nucleoside triphosphate hydrolase protein n=1 Tax=Lipomyces oligophaga TaxID=45792 RepID=UPI0034CEBA30